MQRRLTLPPPQIPMETLVRITDHASIIIKVVHQTHRHIRGGGGVWQGRVESILKEEQGECMETIFREMQGKVSLVAHDNAEWRVAEWILPCQGISGMCMCVCVCGVV